MKSKILDLAQTLAIVAGVAYGAVEIRNFREARDREVMIELLHTFQSPEYMRAFQRLRDMPEGLDAKQVRAALGDDLWIAYMVGNTYEGLGVMVREREIPLKFIEDFAGGGARLAWRRLSPVVIDTRRKMRRPTLFENFQWLIETLDREYPPGKRAAVYDEFKDWKP